MATVVDGKRMGRSIGFPTLNLPWSPEARPRLGVYVVRLRGRQNQWLSGVANYGLRPSVEDASIPMLEVHSLDPCPYDVGDRLQVRWLDFIRPECRFDSLDALRAAIDADVRSARDWFVNHPQNDE